MFGRWRILQGDCRDVLRTLAAGSVQTVVTSPPYWGLRDYGVAGQLGLERTPAEYVTNMVEVFREVRRVLRDDGTLWLNLGDSYVGGGHGGPTGAAALEGSRANMEECRKVARRPRLLSSDGLKQKDLAGTPWRVAFALQADGWYLRRDIIWSKPNAMPESVTDRPTGAHEYLFLLSKSEIYFYDAEAIKERVAGTAHPRGGGTHPKSATPSNERGRIKANSSFSAAVTDLVDTRNKRSVWTIATEPFKDAHFATFPMELVKPCILAGTSAVGCCARCGSPFERIVEKAGIVDNGGGRRKRANVMRHAGATSAFVTGEHASTRTVAWVPSCSCEHAPGYAPPTRCTVLDPFNGAGTTGVVATRFGRDYIGIELKREYAEMAERRIADDAPLFNVAGQH